MRPHRAQAGALGFWASPPGHPNDPNSSSLRARLRLLPWPGVPTAVPNPRPCPSQHAMPTLLPRVVPHQPWAP